jgi:hypothetical protein
LERYKSWSAIKKQLEGFLCSSLSGKISYFLTRYHKVHDCYGRASIRLNGEEMVCFSMIEVCNQEYAISELHANNPKKSYKCMEDMEEVLKPEWDENCTYSDYDFINAAQKYFHLTVQDALESNDYIIKIFAILDRRVGKRTLNKILSEKNYLDYPDWVQQFYTLRLNCEK